MRFSHDLGCVLYSCPRLEFHARAAACSHATVPSSSSSSSSRSRRAMLEGQYCEVSMSCRNRYAPRLISLSRIKTRRNKVSIIHKHFCFSLLSLTHNRRGYLVDPFSLSRIQESKREVEQREKRWSRITETWRKRGWRWWWRRRS